MEPWYYLAIAGVGVAAGWLNVMAGGGSLLTIPAMLFLGLPGPVANGTNRIAILAQNVIAVSEFARQGYANFRLSLSLSLAASIGAAVGASFGTQLGGAWFDRVLAGVMLAVMILMATDRRRTERVETSGEPRNLVAGHFCMVLAGLWGGFIQIGVGFVLMPVLHRVMGLNLVHVNMHKVFIVLTYTVVALAIFASQVDIAWTLGLALAAGNALGGWLGATTTIRRGEKLIRVVLYAALSALIIKLLFF